MAIKIEDLVMRYGDRLVLDFFDMEVQDGEIFGLLGTSGAGKSTVIDCMLGQLKYDRGEITIFSEKMTKKNHALRRKIGIVPQQLVLLKELTVYENVDYFCSLYVTDGASRRGLVQDAINLCDLCSVADAYPNKISPGMLRRLNLACGIAHQPQLLIVDEPYTGTDALSRETIASVLKLLHQGGMTILYVSKDIEEMSHLCTRIAIMEKGKILITATADELKAIIFVGEKVTIEVFKMTADMVEEISMMKGVVFANYANHELVVKSDKGKNNLANILHFLEDRNIPFGKVYSEVPMLRDVFWEITGREL